MPLKSGRSKKVQEANFHELRHGKTYAHTADKFGKKKANAQMVAIVMDKAGMSKNASKRVPKKDRRGYY